MAAQVGDVSLYAVFRIWQRINAIFLHGALGAAAVVSNIGVVLLKHVAGTTGSLLQKEWQKRNDRKVYGSPCRVL